MTRNWLAHYPQGVPATIDPESYASVAALVEHSCTIFADRCAFSNLGATLSFADIERQSRAFGAYLQQSLGMVKGERIALMMANCLQYPIALFGALRAGLIVVTVNPLYTARELQHQLTDAEVKTLLVMENFAATLEKIHDAIAVEHIIITQIGDMLGAARRPAVNFIVRKIRKNVPAWELPGTIDFRKTLAKGGGQRLEPVALSGDDLAFLQYTGGTTGPARGARLSHANIVANVMQCRAWFAPEMDDAGEVIITALPMYHIFALSVNTLVYFSFGGHNVLVTDPRDTPAFVKLLGRYPFSVMTGVNTLYNALLNTEGFADLDFSTLKFSLAGGSATQQIVAQRWFEVTGRPIIEGYGLSETAPVVCCNRLDTQQFNRSIGFPLPSTDIDIRDDSGRTQPADQPGELCVRGPQVMSGYWRDDNGADTFTEDGFFRTGDIARQDGSGLFYIVDRKKDMILVSGFNVYPNEIEDVVARHEDVLEAAAISVPDETSGEAIKLFVVKRNAQLEMKTIRQYCRDQLAGYKVPKHYEFIRELPKSSVGKILRKELR